MTPTNQKKKPQSKTKIPKQTNQPTNSPPPTISDLSPHIPSSNQIYLNKIHLYMNFTSFYTQAHLAVCTGLLPQWAARIHPRKTLLHYTLIEGRMENHYLSEVLGDVLLNETRGT